MTSTPSPAEQQRQQQTNQITRMLRCLECNGQSIYDSKSRLAASIRATVNEKLQAGASPQEILDFFSARYGERILMKPPVRAATLPLWGAPFLFGLSALAFVFYRKHIRAKKKDSQ